MNFDLINKQLHQIKYAFEALNFKQFIFDKIWYTFWINFRTLLCLLSNFKFISSKSTCYFFLFLFYCGTSKIRFCVSSRKKSSFHPELYRPLSAVDDSKRSNWKHRNLKLVDHFVVVFCTFHSSQNPRPFPGFAQSKETLYRVI